MKRKRCPRCGQTKRGSEFGKRHRNGKEKLNSYCRLCMNAYHVERRTRSPAARESHNAIVSRRKQEMVEEVARLKAKTPCTDCGRKHKPWKMQFDHVRGKKIGNIAQLMRCGSPSKLRKEIAKCEIVCANCHADRTHRRNNGTLAHSGERRFCTAEVAGAKPAGSIS